MSSAIAVPTKNAGELFIPALGRTIQQIEWREDDFYDAVQAPATITAGTTLELFRDLAAKNLQHTNLRTQRRIPAGSELLLARVGVHLAQAFGDTLPTDADLIKVAHDATLSFKINDRLITEGPLFKFQSGYGMTGSTTRTGTGVVTTGVPSAAAAPSLFVAQPVGDTDDLNGQIVFPDNSWLGGGTAMPVPSVRVVAQCFLHGIIKKPQGK